jgi:hypothetical protein
MPFLWIGVNDGPGPESRRGPHRAKRHRALKQLRAAPLDPPSKAWLGHSRDRERIRSSGLWNWRHVDEQYVPAFLDELESLVEAGGPRDDTRTAPFENRGCAPREPKGVTNSGRT